MFSLDEKNFLIYIEEVKEGIKDKFEISII